MRCSEVVRLSEEDLEILLEGSDEEREVCVREAFDSLTQEEIDGLVALFCTGDRESYNEDAELMDVVFDGETAGFVQVDFTGSAYYGCKDMDRVDEHSEEIRFSISLEGGTITFESNPPDPVERYPDDEF